MSAVVGTRQNLRVSYVWRDEVMHDAVLTTADPVTLGGTDDVSFVVSARLGLPAKFAILRPGARGWVLTLGAGMTGKLRLGGVEVEVEDFLNAKGGDRVGAQGAFKAAGVDPGDWGVIHLDGAGEHTIFFHFVKADPPLPLSHLRDAELLLPAFAFAFILVGVFVAYVYTLGKSGPGFVFPGDRELVANYLLRRPPPAMPEPTAPDEPQAGIETAEKNIEPASTTGKEAKSGGEGETERQRAPDPDEGAADEALPEKVQTGLLSKRSRAAFEKIRNRGGFDKKLGNAMARITGARNDGSRAGSGKGRGTGVGPGAGTGTLTKGTGKGTGGGGKAHADVRTQGKLDTGGKRAARGTPGGRGVEEVAVKVKPGKPSGDFGGLTHAQIMKVVKTRARAIQACYTRELQRSKDLGGKIIVNWTITSSGKVTRARVRSTTMRNGRVEDCVVRQIQSLQFPSPKGGGTARVNFPFLFAQR